MEELCKFIQDVVDEVVNNDRPYDDSTKKWLNYYCHLEQWNEEECKAIIEDLELFCDTLKELKTTESRYLIDMAKLFGQKCTLPETEIVNLMDKMQEKRDNSIAEMESKISEYEATIIKENERYNKEDKCLSELKAKIQQVQTNKAKITQEAKAKAFAKIEPQWISENNELKEKEKQVQSKQAELTELELKVEEIVNCREEKNEKNISYVRERLKKVHIIMLIALAVFLSVMELLFIQTRGLAWVPIVLCAGFVYLRLSSDSLFDIGKYDYEPKQPEFLFSIIPLILMSFEVFFIDACCIRPWLLTFFVLIPTLFVYIIVLQYIKEDSIRIHESIHHIMLVTIAVLVSLAEFFTFGDKIFHFSDDGWGWGIVSLIANVVYIGYIMLFTEVRIYRECLKYEYLLSFLFFAILTIFAYFLHCGWKLFLIPLGYGLAWLAHFLGKLVTIKK